MPGVPENVGVTWHSKMLEICSECSKQVFCIEYSACFCLYHRRVNIIYIENWIAAFRSQRLGASQSGCSASPACAHSQCLVVLQEIAMILLCGQVMSIASVLLQYYQQPNRLFKFDSGELYLHHDLRNAIADAQSEVQQLPCARLGIEFAARIPAKTINMGQ